MCRLLVHVEGQTEETFVNSVLAPHLYAHGYTIVAARLLGNARAKARRGGIRDWHVVKSEIDRHLANDAGCIATLMVDYYALPDNWPGRVATKSVPYSEKSPQLEEAIHDDFALTSERASRFEPFVLMHEFEALLFSDCDTFAEAVGHPAKVPDLQAVRDAFATPEEINDSPITAPSKRVSAIIPGYQKPLFGNVAALAIGMAKIRAECPRFSNWVARLEARIACDGK